MTPGLPDRDDVRYVSCAGARPLSEMLPLFRPWASLVERQAGDNDSQVPVSSAHWGEHHRVVRADHLELAGWSLGLKRRRSERPFDHISLYKDLIVRARGAQSF